MSGTYADGLEAAARWHDKQARTYGLDVEALRAAGREARADTYEALCNEHRASASIIRGMIPA